MGINLNLHYCHGEVDSISLFVEDGSCICDEAFPDRMDKMTCCFDKNYKYDLDTDQLFTPFSNFEFKLTEYIQNQFFELNFNFIALNNTIVEALNIPPPNIIQDIPFRILHSVFRL